jgi:hypothetical protein
MKTEQHNKLIEMAMCSDNQTSQDIIKYMIGMQNEIDELKEILKSIVHKDYPEDLIKFQEFLRTD